MTTAREIMRSGDSCVRTEQTAADAARMMAELGFGALPICGPDDKVKGVVTDRDLVIKVMAHGRDAGAFPAGDLNQAEAVTVGADDDAEEVFSTLTEHQVRRLPVIDQGRLVGMIGVADVVGFLRDPKIGDMVRALAAT